MKKIIFSFVFLIIFMGVVEATDANLYTYGLTRPCNLGLNVNYTDGGATQVDTLQPIACWADDDEVGAPGTSWWHHGAIGWGWNLQCSAGGVGCTLSSNNFDSTMHNIRSANFTKTEGMAQLVAELLIIPGISTGCNFAVRYAINDTTINLDNTWPQGSYSNVSLSLPNVSNGELIYIDFADNHDFSDCRVRDIRILDHFGREMSFWSGSINVYPLQTDPSFGINVNPVGGVGEAYYVAFARENGTADWTCDAWTFGSGNLSDSLSLTMWYLSEGVVFETNTNYQFRVGYFNKNTQGEADARACNVSSNELIVFTDTANAVSHECYDMGDLPYSTDCFDLLNSTDWVCSSSNMCMKLNDACDGKGYDFQCDDKIVQINGTTSVQCSSVTHNCWCDWLSWQEPICNLKAATGEPCYTYYGCENSVCTGYDTGVGCNCGQGDCSNTSHDCLYGSSAGPASDHCWVEGVCGTGGGAAGTGMYLNVTDHLIVNGTITLNWSVASNPDFGFYSIYYDFPDYSSNPGRGYVKLDTDTDWGCPDTPTSGNTVFFWSELTNKTNIQVCGIGPLSYQIHVYDNSFQNIINWTNWIDVEVAQCYVNSDCGEGMVCSEGNICIPPGECLVDGDCPADKYCSNPYNYLDEIFWIVIGKPFKSCHSKREDGHWCFRDDECSSGNCTGEEGGGSCTYSSGWVDKFDECVEVGVEGGYCFSDGTCAASGYCYNLTNTCGSHADCESRYGNYDWWCSSDGLCVEDSQDGGYCEYNESCLGFESTQLKCIERQCVPHGWDCNYNLDGCLGETVCDGGVGDTPSSWTGTHLCVNCTSMGENCEHDSECCPPLGQCLAGICSPASWMCKYNNNGGGVISWYPEAYCGEDTSELNTNWCYSEYLAYGAPATSDTPDHMCYPKYVGGQSCSENYQCIGRECDDDSHKCLGGAPVPTPSGAGIFVYMASKTNPETDFAAGETIYLWVKFFDKDGNLVTNDPNTPKGHCRWLTGGFQTQASDMESGGVYFSQQVSLTETTGVYLLGVECYTFVETSGGGEIIDQTNYFSNDTYWFNVLDGSSSSIDCSAGANSECPTDAFSGQDDFLVRVRHTRLDGSGIRTSTCNLTMDYDVEDASVTYPLTKIDANSYYYYNNSIYIPGIDSDEPYLSRTHRYLVWCSFGDYEADKIVEIDVEGGHCRNNVQDGDEEGLNCGGSCRDECPGHCENNETDYDKGETDLNCGGPCERCRADKKCKRDGDCRTDYCHPCADYPPDGPDYGITKKCRVPICEDKCLNQDEIRVDCGGSCEPCSCTTNLECSDDGSYICVISSYDGMGACEPVSCSNNGDCTPVLLGASTYETCCDLEHTPHLCRATACDVISETQMDVIGASGKYFINASGQKIWLHVCSEGETGYSVSTSQNTIKYYTILDTDLRPSIPPRTGWHTFGGEGGEYTLTASDKLDKLCMIQSGYDYSWNEIAISAATRTALEDEWSMRTIYGLSVRGPFEVDVQRGIDYEEDKVFTFNLTRPGMCNVSNYFYEEKTPINSATSDFIIFNYTGFNESKPLVSFYYSCTSIYGETVEGTYTYNFLDYWEWQSWMIYLIVFIIAIPVPLIVLVLLMWSRGREL